MIVFYQHRTIIGSASVHDGAVHVERLHAWLTQHRVMVEPGRVLTIADGEAWLRGLVRTLRAPYLYALTDNQPGTIESLGFHEGSDRR